MATSLTENLIQAHAQALDGDPTALAEKLDALIAESRGYVPAVAEQEK